jgi:hypothetical protein
MKARRIVIDGKTFQNVEEMPEDIRRKYEQAIQALGDANGNGIPDAFETLNIFADKDKNGAPDIVENLVTAHNTVSQMKIVVDGKEFDGIENLPPEVRARFDEAMSKLDANGNGIPDFMEGLSKPANQAPTIGSSFTWEAARRSSALPSSSTTAPDTSSGWRLVLTGLFILLLCAAGAAGVWYLFLR